MSVAIKTDIHTSALALVSANIKAEPAIIKAYLFPSDSEIRLIYVDPTTSPLPAGERIAPFYFGRNPSEGWHYTSAVALVLPAEVERAALPEGWADWKEAEVVYPQGSVPLED